MKKRNKQVEDHILSIILASTLESPLPPTKSIGIVKKL
jgi:hypothetical protein